MIRRPDDTRDVLHAGYTLLFPIGNVDGLETDASLLHLAYDAADRITGGLAVDGRYLEPQSERITFLG